MKCWAVRKMLSLYVGDKDLPFFHTHMREHIERCSRCSHLYHQYCVSQKALQSLKQLAPPNEVFTGYWEVLQKRFDKEPLSLAFIPLWRRVWIPAGAATLLLFMCFYTFWQAMPDIFSPTISRQFSHPTHSNLFLPSRISVLRAYEHTSFRIPGLIREYQLNEVHPIEKREASF